MQITLSQNRHKQDGVLITENGAIAGLLGSGSTSVKYWAYQDFTLASSAGVTLTTNENRDTPSAPIGIIDGTAVLVDRTGNPVGIWPLRKSVSSHVSTSIVFNAAVTGDVRIYWLQYGPVPLGAQVAPKFVQKAMMEFLDNDYVNQVGDESVSGYKTFTTGIKSYLVNFDPTATPGAPVEGDVWWNSFEKGLNIASGLGPVAQVPYETWVLVYNDTVSTLTNGSSLNSIAVFNNVPSVIKADATTHSGVGNVLIATMDIAPSSYGIATEFGLVRDFNTAAIPGAGPLLYVDPAVPGGLTRTRPEFPNFRILVGAILKEGTTDGIATISIRETARDTIFNNVDGCIRETIRFIATSDGATITGTLDNQNNPTRDLTLVFSDGFTIFDTTPPATITLTPGTDSIPQTNYVYIPKSTKVLTVSTSDWPEGTEHIKVATLELKSAATTKIEGSFRNQNWNDHIKTEANNGHILHIAERLRQENSKWNSGAEGSVVVGAGGADYYVKTTAGVVYQLHRQNFPILDMVPYTIDAVNQGSKTFTISDDGDLTSDFPVSRIISVRNSTGNDGLYTVASTSYAAPNFIITVNETIPNATADGEVADDIHVVNDFTTPYRTVASLADVTTDASGDPLLNTSFSIVVWGVMNKSNTPSHIMVNFPTSTYSKNFPENAVNDSLNYSVYDIPKKFQGVGFLIARFTMVNNNGVYSLYATEDLRGKIPNTTAGGGAGGTGVTTFLGLTDTPSAYTGLAGYLTRIAAGETALEFLDPSTDFLSQYVLLAGRTGGQVIYGSGTTAETLTLYNNSIDQEGILIDESGNVGIGTVTVVEKLTVDGDVRFTKGTLDYSTLTFYRNEGGANIGINEVLGYIRIAGTEGGGEVLDAGGIKFVSDGAWGPDGPTRIEFLTFPNGGTAPFVRMLIDEEGSVELISQDSIGGKITLYRNDTGAIGNNTSLGGLHAGGVEDDGVGAGTINAASIQFFGAGTWATADYPSMIKFYTTSADAATSLERMVIAENGFVGIGTDTPDNFLEILGTTAQLRLTHTDAIDYAEFEVNDAGILNIRSSNSIITFGVDALMQYDATNHRLTINADNATITTPYGAIHLASDTSGADTGIVFEDTDSPTVGRKFWFRTQQREFLIDSLDEDGTLEYRYLEFDISNRLVVNPLKNTGGDFTVMGLTDEYVFNVDASADAVGIGVEFPTAKLDVSKTGTVKSNIDIFRLTNPANALDMDGTTTSILFRNYYYDAATPAASNSARITVGTETDWTSTLATRDAYMSFTVARDGVLTEGLRISSVGHVNGFTQLQYKTQTISYAASITPDANSGTAITIGTLTGAITINAMSNQAAGSYGYFIITADSTDRVITWNSNYLTTGGVKTWTLPALTTMTVHFFSDGTNVYLVPTYDYS